MADDAEPLTLADLKEVTWSIQYGLGWDERGRPRGVKVRANDQLTAQWLVEHLTRSGYVIMRKSPLRSHG